MGNFLEVIVHEADIKIVMGHCLCRFKILHWKSLNIKPKDENLSYYQNDGWLKEHLPGLDAVEDWLKIGRRLSKTPSTGSSSFQSEK